MSLWFTGNHYTGCKWGEQCENQRFQRRQYPATKLVKAGGRGWGLVVEEDVTPGTLVHEYVGEIIDEQEVVNRLQNYQASGITDYYMVCSLGIFIILDFVDF